MNQSHATLDEIRITGQLAARAPRPRDFEAENEALLRIARSLAGEPGEALRALTDAGVRLCGAGSCGVSLLDPEPAGGGVFRWVSLSGALHAFEGGTTPMAFSPCGVCLEYGAPQLFEYPGRYFHYLDNAPPRISEGLVIPFRGRQQVMGTIWIAAHDAVTRFTASDVQTMSALADFTAAATVLLGDERRVRDLLEHERAARQTAQDADRAKDFFLATVSHELRTPLNAVLGWADLLTAGNPLPAERDQAISGIQDNASRLGRLVDDLFDASGAARGQLAVAVEPVDISRVVAAAARDARAAAVAAGLRLETQLAADPVHVMGDEGRIRQVLSNLLENAVKFTPADGVIRVELSADGREVTVRVSDSGIGLTADFLPSIFTPFSQADSGTARRFGGLGLGLSIASDIVRRHHGRIAAHSDGPHCGSCFTVTLPRADSAAIAPARPCPPRTAADPVTLAGVRVLIVDDQPDARDVLAAMLAHHGASVRTSESAAGALDLLRGQDVDVLLADIAMPGEDGFALIAQARALERSGGPRLAAVAVTALAQPGTASQALAAGFDAHLLKPVRTAPLLSAIAALVDAGRASTRNRQVG